ncbi:hypothetical protein FFI97_015165 [Variovorax sp. KBS0712]|uniref:hypothetical protein n=1 Tax=Variovorax sp. KBS0712 TaxID=2578111 RepID=UPI0011198862|nr:hypothetical protein [Variovorax sp. KBS0712]TSD61522.1 hypothetical protein FFI97_015165 [Variovorax sp. KBS0712]
MAIQFKHALGVAALALLTACGGGGGGGGGPVFGLPSPNSGTGTGGPAGPSEPETPAPVGDEPPQARVAKPIDTTLGLVLKLDGRTSQAAQGRSLRYVWVLQSKPLNSKAVLTGADSATPSFLPDVPGEFVVRLVVNDGVKDSEAAYLTVTPTAPAATGPHLKFALIETLAAPDNGNRYIPDASCGGYRSDTHFKDFWPTALDARDCFAINSPLELEGRSMGSGSAGSLDFLVRRMGETVVATPGTLPADTPATPVSAAYEVTANPEALARTPIGKSNGFSFRYSLEGARMIYWPDDPRVAIQRPKARYRIAGTVVPANAPLGWEVTGQTSVRIEVTLITDRDSPYVKVPVYSKTFDTEFSENVELDLNAAVYQVVPNTQGIYTVEVVHKLVYRRKPS